jgi:hypothetical protein
LWIRPRLESKKGRERERERVSGDTAIASASIKCGYVGKGNCLEIYSYDAMTVTLFAIK